MQGDQPATGLRPRYPAHPPASTRRARPGHTRDPARRPVCEATADRRQLLCRFATIILAGPQRGRGCDSPAVGLRETGRTVFCSTLSSSAIEGDRLVGMRESRALCEISKSCGKPICGFHRMSFPQPIAGATTARAPSPGMLYPCPHGDRRSWRLQRGRFRAAESSAAFV